MSFNQADSLVDEPLDSGSVVRFGDVDVSFRICGDIVRAEELAGLSSTATERSQHLEVTAKNYVDLFVHPVDGIDIFLLGIA